MSPGGHRLSGIAHFLETLIANYGIPALFVSVCLEALGAPLPGESAVIAASTAAAAGKLSITAVVVTAFLAAVLGDNIGYLLGRRLGRPVIIRYGARFGITDAAFDKVEAVARKRGPLMVVIARFVVVLRQLNGIVAGTSGMPWPVFLAANAAGAALWVGLWATLAYRFGRSTDVLPYIWHHLTAVMMIAIPLIVAGLVVLRLLMRKAA